MVNMQENHHKSSDELKNLNHHYMSYERDASSN